jgi:hypothetical protein
MNTRRCVAPLVALFALIAASSTPAAADTLPNLVALSTPDMQVAVTYAASPNGTTLANAGAFATDMSEQFGMVPIPNFEAARNPDSILVCEAPVTADELMGVYGIQGPGVSEANSLCQYLSDAGNYVRWR